MPRPTGDSIETRLARAGLPPLRRSAWIEVDLSALAANVGVLRRIAGPGVAILPVVKADAYGHGMVPVAAALESAGVDGLCLATLDEAVTLVEHGISAPLLVLYPIPVDGVAELTRHGIRLGGGSPDGLAPILERASALGVADRLAIELEIETGLGRGGVSPEAAVDAANEILAAGARLEGVWSHLQEAEVADLTAHQVARFEDAVRRLAEAGIAVPRRHLAASAGILLGSAPVYEAVRRGLVTYGLIPDELAPAGFGHDE